MAQDRREGDSGDELPEELDQKVHRRGAPVIDNTAENPRAGTTTWVPPVDTATASIVRSVMPSLSEMIAVKLTASHGSIMRNLAPGLSAMAAADVARVMPSHGSIMKNLAPGLSAMAAADVARVMPSHASIMKNLAPGLSAMAAADVARVMPSYASIMKNLAPGLSAMAMSKHMIGGLQFGSGFGASNFTSTYLSATQALLAKLRLSTVDAASFEFDIEPTRDSSAYEAIALASPEAATAIDDAARLVETPSWSRDVIRNTLAWFLATLVVCTYVAGSVAFFPWGPVLVGLLGSGGVTAPAVYRKVARPKDVGEPQDMQPNES